ncbi:hypothetical protein F4780DRAFT_797497 [Xylariomycetidae sp. FL0641]|nr:hypothetical protein F4780DRAFT_797497 [Xylariomycetidae sp. FL0641]
MPTFRGIDLAVITGSGVQRLEEYPHHNGSSIRPMRSINTQSPSPGPTLQRTYDPRVSVYIPSSPGEPFWLRYNVVQQPPPSRWLYFKLYFNGHPTVSWGIDTEVCVRGRVSRALYKPGDRWGEDGVAGIESRYFHFVRNPEERGAANDGGLIEVQVFRCKGRKRSAVMLDPYRHREHYGITIPSGGLLDSDDATYYDYYLADAKDSPYATFRFHYRSLQYLEMLNIKPSEGAHQDFDIQPLRVNKRLARSAMSPDALSPETATLQNAPVTSRQCTFDVRPLQTQLVAPDSVFDGASGLQPSEGSESESQIPEEPPKLLPPSSVSHHAPDPSKASRDDALADILQRPLPELPKSVERPPSQSSVHSNCPSLTPSLQQYAESEDFEKEDVRLSTAQPMLISSESMQALQLDDLCASEEATSFLSNYTASCSSGENSPSRGLPPPEGYIATTGSVLEQHLAQFDSFGQNSPRGRLSIQSSSPEGTILGDDSLTSHSGTLSLTEAEWLRHTPSPMKRRSRLMQRLWSPRPDRRSNEFCPGQRREEKDMAPEGNWI